jgi:DNA-binding transcriptional ArsR family regulator
LEILRPGGEIFEDLGKSRKLSIDNMCYTLQSVAQMQLEHPLRPTLWRTCRILANRTRLRAIGLLIHQPDQTVSGLAEQLNLSVAAASQYLRALESRGLLVARRIGRYVKYRLPPASTASPAFGLVFVLKKTFRQRADPIESIFKLATAFTHPRRLQILQALHKKHHMLSQLQRVTRMSNRALYRHLKKLEARKLIVRRRGICEIKSPGKMDPVASELMRMIDR